MPTSDSERRASDRRQQSDPAYPGPERRIGDRRTPEARPAKRQP